LSFLNRKIDEFCARNRNFGIPGLMRFIILGSALYYMFGRFMPIMLEFIPFFVIHDFQIWQIFTFVFTISRSDFLFLVFAFMFAYYVGGALENTWGTAKFNLFYLGSMIITVVVGLVVTLLGMPGIYVATGDFMYYSMIFAFALLYPEVEIRFMMVIPLKMKFVGLLSAVYIVFSLYYDYLRESNYAGALALLTPLFVVAVFFWPDFLRLMKRGKHKTSRQTINFNTAQREAKKAKGYLHKCEVCGETDGTAPTLEFRYCSKCNGHHCYCSEHINNHEHVE